MTGTQIAWRVWLPLALLGGWELCAATGTINTLFFPAPSTVARAGWDLGWSGELGRHVVATLARTGAGFAAGLVPGIVIGLAMGRSRRVRWSIEPLVSTLVSIPKLSLLPLLLLVLGVGERPRIALAGVAAFVVVALQTLDAVRSINADHVELARNYGATPWGIVRWVYWPAALPQLSTGVRLALGRALAVTIAVEIVGAPRGLGSLIWAGWQTFAIERIYVGIFVSAMLGAVFHFGMRGLERRLVPWRA